MTTANDHLMPDIPTTPPAGNNRKKKAVSPNPQRAGKAATGLRLAGASYPEIAETLGLEAPSTARTLVENELALNSEDTEERSNLRREEAARIERLLMGVWNKAITPTHPEHLPAARMALAIIDRHSKLLGLDMPTEVVVYTPTTTEIDNWVAAMTQTTNHVLGEIVEADVVDP